MTSLTFYGGVNEIGGNKVLLERKNLKAYLDFGESFNFGEDYFYEYLQPRAANGLECYFEFDLVPKIRKLYSKKMLRFTDLPHEKPDIDAVFITHHHSDHIGHLKFLDEEIPLHMGHGTKKLIDIYHDLYPQFTDIGEHSNINLFKSGDDIKVKDTSFKPIHVEHSTPGAYGYVISTPDESIVYTGDFRLHGPKKNLSEDFIDEAKKSEPKVLICEGTRVTPDPETQYSEEQVFQKVKGIIEASKGLVFAEFSMCNIDRFNSFYKACLETGRTLVIDTRYAHLLEQLSDKVKLPNVKENLKVYFKLCKSCNFSESDYKIFEREYLGSMLTFNELRKSPKDYVLFSGFNKLMELVYLKPKDAVYIYSSSEHFLEGEGYEERRDVLYNWLKHFKVKMEMAHCSGHASKQDLERAIKKINPEILIPIHTENPEVFKDFHDNVQIVKKNTPVTL